jgi:hypothetical protein
MGWGICAAFVYGVTLRNAAEADVVYGLQMRLNERYSRGAPCPDVPRVEEQARPKWIGFTIKAFRGIQLPEDMLYRAWELPFAMPATLVEPRLARFGDPSNDEFNEARTNWRAFSTWCRERNVYLREERVLFVTDYD